MPAFSFPVIGTLGAHGPIAPHKFYQLPVSTTQNAAIEPLAGMGTNPQLLFQPSNTIVAYNFDNQDVPAGSLHLLPLQDEDFWQNPVAPVVASLFQSLPYGQLWDPEELPAGKLTITLGSGDGSSSTAGYVIGAQGSQLLYSFDPDFPAHTGFVQVFTPDEDFWTPQVAPVNPEPTILWFSDDVAIVPSFDEDFWQNAVAPDAGVIKFPQPWAFETGEWTPPPVFIQGTLDEDFWVSGVAPVVGSLLRLDQWSFDPNDIPGRGQPDEDFWINPVAPVPLAFAPFFQHNIDDQQTLTPVVPGDFDQIWMNPVAPVPGTMYLRLPYWPDNGNEEMVPVIIAVPTGQGGYLVYGLQLVNRHVSHI